MTWVTVRQISQTFKPINGAFMNVDESELHVSVSTIIYQHPTYLIQNGIHATFIQFDSQEMADEWLDEKRKPEWKVTRLEDVPVAV